MTTEQGESGRVEYVRAGLGARLAARLVDVVVSAGLGAVAFLCAALVMAPFFLSGISFEPGRSSGDRAGLEVLAFVLLVAVGFVVARYEPARLARGVESFGKQLADLEVVSYSSGGVEGLSRRCCWLRWGLPYGVLVAVGVVGGLLGRVVVDGWWWLVALGAGVAGWCVVYGSVLLDPQGRGWHDKLAGTLVVAVQRRDNDEHAQPAVDTELPVGHPNGSSPVVLRKSLAVVLVVAVSLAAGAATAAGAYGMNQEFGWGRTLGGGPDKIVIELSHRTYEYDPTYRQECGYSTADRVYYCELGSIGGLLWNTGDIGKVDHRAGYLGADVLCVMAHDGVRCWGWNNQVLPRPTPAPPDVTLDRFWAGDGFVCGQTLDYYDVVCWTVGVDQPKYKQAFHRFTSGPNWRLTDVRNRPPSFQAHQQDVYYADTRLRRFERFDAFPGELLVS